MLVHAGQLQCCLFATVILQGCFLYLLSSIRHMNNKKVILYLYKNDQTLLLIYEKQSENKNKCVSEFNLC